MQSDSKFPIILPSETQSREFDAKLLLAGHLALNGHAVVVGSRVEIHNRIYKLPRGLYLAKDIRGSSRRMFRIADQLGFAIVAWDEEAIFVSDPNFYHQTRVDDENLNRIRAFLALGSQNRTLIETAPGYCGTPIYETGNPRMDLLTPNCRELFKAEVSALREKFGQFILINTNFGKVNHFVESQAARRKAGGGFENLSGRKPDWWEFKYNVFDGFKEMLPVLVKAFPDHQIVIRPHPSESHEVWHDVAGGASNVTVVHEGNVYPWIMASAVAIHNGCTTGLESYLLDHPVIAFHPVTSTKYSNPLSNQVSTQVRSLDELVSTLSAFLAGGKLPDVAPETRAAVEAHLGSLGGALSCERISDLVSSHGKTWLAQPRPARTRASGLAHAMGRRLVKTVNSYRPGHKNNRLYAEHRFPSMSLEDVNARLAVLNDITGKFSELKARTMHPNVFVVSKQPT